jgi:hypothetical protein
MILFQIQHLTPLEIGQIEHLPNGNFNERTLQKLITKLSSNFEPYKPDKAILQYLNNHARQLGLDPPSFANPKDKSHNSDKSEKNKSSSSLSFEGHRLWDSHTYKYSIILNETKLEATSTFDCGKGVSRAFVYESSFFVFTSVATADALVFVFSRVLRDIVVIL